MIQKETPIEKYSVGRKEFYVKREDLFVGSPFPALAKLRGVIKVIEKVKAKGIKKIGVLDTRVSKSGWGIAALCKDKDIKVLCFYPKLKAQVEIPENQRKAKELGAELVGIKAQRTTIMYSHVQNYCKKRKAFLMPMGLVLKETYLAVSQMIARAPEPYRKFRSVVVCLGTGTIFAGVWGGFAKADMFPTFWGVSCGMCLRKIRKRVKGLLEFSEIPLNMRLMPSYCDYYFKENIKTPFPSSPYYDKKTYKWMIENYKKLEKPVLFWNIGV